MAKPGPTAIDPDAVSILKEVSTATITTILLKKGLRSVWIRSALPLRTDQSRIVGPAFTMRFVPSREDLATPASWSSPISTRAAIEAMPEGCIAVIETMGLRDAGVFGDILVSRMVNRGVAGMVTDGSVRDLEGILGTGLPVWCAGIAAPPAVASLHFVGWNETIGCGNVCILPNETIVADRDGAVVIPDEYLSLVLSEAVEQERLEAWIVSEVERGHQLLGLYPMSDETRQRYESWKNGA